MSQKLVIGPGSLAVASAAAIIIAVVLIIVGSMGIPAEEEASPQPSPSSLTDGTVRGSPNAPITIVEFSDFQCYFCQEFANITLRKLENTYIETGKVRLVHRHSISYGEESMLAALASECAAEQGKFWPYYDLLMGARASPKVIDLTRDRLEGFARELGLDISQFNASLDSGRYREKITQDYNLGEELGITGTPTFFINGIKVGGNKSFEVFQKLIEEQLGGSGN